MTRSTATPAAAPVVTRDDGRIALSGDLTLKTARELFERTPSFPAGTVGVALEAVRDADSAGLALLVHWSNRARASGAELVFTGAPAQLRQLAKISGVDGLLAD